MRRCFQTLLAIGSLVGCVGDATDIEPEPEVHWVHAPGIRLTSLAINQGVETELVAGDAIRTPDDYAVQMLADRPMLVRANFSVHHEFAARELLGRLTVRYPDDTLDAEGAPLVEWVEDSVVMVDGDSNPDSLSGTFGWYLERDKVRPGMRVRVDAVEVDPLPEGEIEPEPDPDAVGADRIDGPALPWAQADAPIELSTAPMRLKIKLVPVQHELDDCIELAEIDDEDVAAMAAELAQSNGVHDVEMSVRDPVVWTEAIGEQDNGFSPILAWLSQIRIDDGAPVNEYWYGLVVTCDGFPAGLAGQAFGVPGPEPELAYQRVAAGRWIGDGALAAETFVHEIGHLQGRYHVRCSGTEAGIDSEYPHPGGITGVWGFGIFDLGLHSPAGSRDYMTYCANEWVSDYGWNHTWDRIEGLTAIDGATLSNDTPEILVGMLHLDGTSQWWTTRGSVGGDGNQANSITWDIAGQLVCVEAGTWELPDGDSVVVTALVPDVVTAEASFVLDGPIVEEHGVQSGQLASLRRAR